jgi:hypothetical protein
MPGKPLEIVCSACGAEAFLRREPVYEGFRKTGERLSCSQCGHEYAGEQDVPFKARRAPSVFSEDDKPKTVDLFQSDEKGRNCRHCVHYVVNPFIQRCALCHREVQATDVCERFERREPDADQEA